MKQFPVEYSDINDPQAGKRRFLENKLRQELLFFSGSDCNANGLWVKHRANAKVNHDPRIAPGYYCAAAFFS